MKRINDHLPFWIITITILIVTTLIPLFRYGMFFDGLTYSSIARNLSLQSFGSLNLNLHYTDTLGDQFFDQPPLAIFLQSIFFRLFGDHDYTEKIYCAICLFLTCYLILKIWNLIFQDHKELKPLSWLPILLFGIIPVAAWSFSNNMLENTMCVFDLAAVFFTIKFLVSRKHFWQNIIYVSACITLAVYMKGPVGLYPVAIPLLFLLIFKEPDKSRIAILTLIPIFFICSISALLYFSNESAKSFMENYINNQLLRSIGGRREITVSNHFYILYRFFSELILPAIFVLSVIFVSKVSKIKYFIDHTLLKFSIVFFTLSLLGCLAIAFSPKQAGYYLVPIMPMMALSFALIAAQPMSSLINKLRIKRTFDKHAIVISLFILFVCVFIDLSFISPYKRDKAELMLMEEVRNIIPKGEVISVCPELITDWRLHAYFMRYLRISLDDNNAHEYFITNATCLPKDTSFYLQLPIQSDIYRLYRLKS